MKREFVRDLFLSMVLGDGNLSVRKTSSKSDKKYGYFSVCHSSKQGDYLEWKRQMIAVALGRKVNLQSTGTTHDTKQIQVCWRRFKAWYGVCYPNRKKSTPSILKWIKNPYLALAIWLMDDGYVESSGNQGEKHYPCRFRLYNLMDTYEDQLKTIEWFKSLGLTAKVVRYKGKTCQQWYIKVDAASSMKIWKEIRPFVLQFKSMQYKFRKIESYYKQTYHSASQEKTPDEIV